MSAEKFIYVVYFFLFFRACSSGSWLLHWPDAVRQPHVFPVGLGDGAAAGDDRRAQRLRCTVHQRAAPYTVLRRSAPHFHSLLVADSDSRPIHTARQRQRSVCTHLYFFFPMFDTGNVILTAMLMLAKVETYLILSH